MSYDYLTVAIVFFIVEIPFGYTYDSFSNMNNILSVINASLKKRPLFFSLTSNTVKAGLADYLTQKTIDGKSEIDQKRLLTFTIFGFSYLGGWQYLLYNKVFTRCEKVMKAYKYSKLSQSCVLTGMDMFVHTPFIYYPTFYSLKGWLENKDQKQSYQLWKTNFKEDMTLYCQLWVPAQIFNFAVLPLHYRMPFITSVSFAWTVLLSMSRG